MVVLGVVGCGTGATGTTSVSSGAAPGSEAAVGANGDTLTVITSPKGNFADNFNPFDPSTNDGTYGNIYETLFYFDNLTGKTWDLLGTSYHFTNGGRSVIVQLRTNAKWTDGTPFTANDVVFTFTRLRQLDIARRLMDGCGILLRRGLSDLSTGMRRVFICIFVGMRFVVDNFILSFTSS